MTEDNQTPQGTVKPYDKLTYKLLIQSRIAKCLEAMVNNDSSLDKNVWALRCGLYFDQGKLKFRTMIEKKEKELDAKYDNWVKEYSRDSNRPQWGNPLFSIPARSKKLNELWTEELLFIIQLLGHYKALFDQLDYVEEWKEGIPEELLS